MDVTEFSLISSLLLGGLGLVIGYLSRIAQKYEDRKDEIYLKFLPSLNQGLSSFIEAKEVFLIDSNLPRFFKNVKDVNAKLDQQLFSGEILFIENDFQKNLLVFRRKLKKFQVILEKVGVSDENAPDDEAQRLKDAFEKEIGYLDTEIIPSSLVDDAKSIQGMINYQIKKFSSILYQIIVMFLIGVSIAAIKYFET